MLPSASDTWLILLVPLSLAMGAVGLATFMWCLRKGQFSDMEGDALRILMEPDVPASNASELTNAAQNETHQNGSTRIG